MKTTPIYHVGLLAKGRTAIFEYRRCVDFLSCEILKYFGQRETTKTAARKRLAETRDQVIAHLNATYPTKQFNRVVID